MLNKAFSEAETLYERMNAGGVFLTTKGEKLNTMTIGWGSTGIMWRRPVFTVLVRLSRFTHQMLEQNGEFSVSVPAGGELGEELDYCGTRSGRNVDKFEATPLTPVEARSISVPVIKECVLHYECRTIFRQNMPAENLSDAIGDLYPELDLHTFYHGEILDCYTTGG